MLQQTTAGSELTRPLAPQLNIEQEMCPSCGQQIPVEKLEEVRGKIALREHEQALLVTAKLEEKYATERAQAQAQVEAVRKAAQETEARAKLEVQRLREAVFSAALEAAETEAKKREDEIRAEAKRVAEIAVAERLAAAELSHKESEDVLQARLAQLESGKTAAEQQATALSQKIEVLQKAKDAEVAKVKEDAALDLARVRKEATEAAEACFQEQLALNENEVSTANAKVLEALSGRN